MSNIFFPSRLSPQGFLNDLIAAQIHSKKAPFPKLKEIIYGHDFIKKTENRLFELYPNDHNKLIKEIEPKSVKGGFLSSLKDEYVTRRYVNFLNTMTPVQQAALIPYIRLYIKQFKDNKFIKTKEIVFNRDYRIPNAPQGYDAGGGKGNAGITSLQVDRDFQYYNVVNRFTVQINFLFDSFDTFANGMQYENIVGAGLASLDANGFSLFADDQASGYISLIKKGSESVEGGFLREHLILEYGYKFPDTISEDIVSSEDRFIFELQEKKELRIDCYKHDFKFSETGEVVLNVTYNAYTDVALASRSEEKTNDVFLISNKGIISEIMDEPSESEIQNLTIMRDLKNQLELLKAKNDRRKELSLTYCGDNNGKEVSEIEKEITEINKKIFFLKKELFNYVYLFFLRYFMATDSLFNIRFIPKPFELEKGVLNPCDNVVRGPRQETVLYIDKITRKTGVEDKVYRFSIPTYYKEKIKETIQKGLISTIDDFTLQNDVLKTTEIKKRFESFKNSKTKEQAPDATEILTENLIHESYSCYEALQTFTLSRLTAQASLVRGGAKAKKCEENTESELLLNNVSKYEETYGNISFFPLRALIAAAIDFTIDEKEDKNGFPIICLGTLLTDSMGKEYLTSIGDLLVDVDYFKEWLFKSFIKMDKMDPTLDDFLNSIFSTLVNGILTTGVGHYTKGNHGHITKRTYEITEKVYNNEELLKKLVSSDKKERDEAAIEIMKDAATASKPSEIKRPLIVYYQETHGRPEDSVQAKAAFIKSLGPRNFDKKQDYSDGIYHVLMGQNSGIVKDINFSYLADPNLNTLFALKNPNHLSSYMKYSYEATINLVGNDLFFRKVCYFAIPRNQFNVGATGIRFVANKDLFGLSGYYQVSRTTDKISMGEYTTTIIARNIMSPDLEELKAKRCKERPGVNDKKPGGKDAGKQTPLNDYVDHDIGQYIFEVFRDDASTAQKFNIRYTEKLEEDRISKTKEIEEMKRKEKELKDFREKYNETKAL